MSKTIIGYENEKKSIAQLKNMLLNFDEYKSNGIRIPKGLILYGECGCGKTVLAKSIVDDFGIKLVELRAGSLCDDKVDDEIKNAFALAKAQTPSVILLDELDKIAGTSDRFFMCDNDNVKKILLQELDGILESDQVVVIATCNDLDSLGDALIRPGRFDRIIHVDLPDEKTREDIAQFYFDKIKIKKDFTYNYVAKITNRYTGAMLEKLANEAGILCMDNNHDAITKEDLRILLNKDTFGGFQKTPFDDLETRRAVAVHEAGHALVSYMLDPDSIYSVSIAPQGKALGHVRRIEPEITLIKSVEQVENRILIALAGRVAQEVVLNKLYLGAENDLEMAYMSLYSLTTKSAAYGYDGLCVSAGALGTTESEYYTEKVDKMVHEKLNEMDKKCRDIITNSLDDLNLIVDALMDKIVLSRDELFALLNKNNNTNKL